MKEKLNALLQEGREKILAAKNETELQDIKAAILGKQGSQRRCQTARASSLASLRG